MKIRDLTDWMIMPQTIEPQGLIHLPGKGPNNRFDFKNKGNNRANEDAAGVGIITKQNTTADVKPGDEYKNVKKLHLEYKEFIENFADGKKPGRKGLAKRVGVNCKQPVAKLRSIAKNSTGEKRRMAHWCANMKSGRSKKK
jgi:hypothetical protein